MNIHSRWEDRKKEIQKRGINLKWLIAIFVGVLIIYLLVSQGIISVQI